MRRKRPLVFSQLSIQMHYSFTNICQTMFSSLVKHFIGTTTCMPRDDRSTAAGGALAAPSICPVPWIRARMSTNPVETRNYHPPLVFFLAKVIVLSTPHAAAACVHAPSSIGARARPPTPHAAPRPCGIISRRSVSCATEIEWAGMDERPRGGQKNARRAALIHDVTVHADRPARRRPASAFAGRYI